MTRLKFLGVAILLVAGVFLSGCGQQQAGQSVKSEPQKTETVVIKVDSKGSPADSTRGTNIADAAKELNQLLEAKGDNRRVKVEVNHVSAGSDEEYNKKFILAWQSGGGADIRAISHADVAMMAKGGYILPLDDLLSNSEYADFVKDIYPTLWEAAKYAGKTWAVPQDTESRPVYFRKDALRKMGWSEDQINQLPEKIKRGEFTLADMTALAKEAVEKGVVKYGIFHRPSNGPYFVMQVYNFGGKIYNPVTDKLVLDKKAVLKTLQYHYDLTQNAKVTPEGMTSMEWRMLHKSFVEGDVLFWYGGTWHWGEYQKVPYHEELGELTEEYMFENIGYALVPAAEKGGRPITLSQPWVYTINSNTKYPDLAFALIAIASKPEYNAKHAIESGHLAISPSVAESPTYQSSEFLADVQYQLEYTTTQPTHPEYGKFKSGLYKAIQAVELGKQKPEEALNWLEDQLKNDLGDALEVIE
ncbi:sugar ABC transporter substrate-binding protein [Calderihabitans maritimus]|uniref:ABC transporter substrate-binding protein n=1 Tax=Calderihabitans maritimus TaxID=1246530 RepID=A0A1Z5HS70_9FIRM|nr:extracellular solute-binding protein [Calderihabitans maritimus]GAW92369.1 ABC transporter substrate-binding protein [Calderihabitans maritimus]